MIDNLAPTFATTAYYSQRSPAGALSLSTVLGLSFPSVIIPTRVMIPTKNLMSRSYRFAKVFFPHTDLLLSGSLANKFCDGGGGRSRPKLWERRPGHNRFA